MKCAPAAAASADARGILGHRRGDEGDPDRKAQDDGDTGNQARMGEPGSDAAFFDHAAHQ
jgi:hypothetical protein